MAMSYLLGRFAALLRQSLTHRWLGAVHRFDLLYHFLVIFDLRLPFESDCQIPGRSHNLLQLLVDQINLLHQFLRAGRLSELDCFDQRTRKLCCQVFGCIHLNLRIPESDEVGHSTHLQVFQSLEEGSHLPFMRVAWKLALIAGSR